MHNQPQQPLDELAKLRKENEQLRAALAHLIQVDDTSTPRDLTYYQQVLQKAKEALNGNHKNL